VWLGYTTTTTRRPSVGRQADIFDSVLVLVAADGYAVDLGLAADVHASGSRPGSVERAAPRAGVRAACSEPALRLKTSRFSLVAAHEPHIYNYII
jgi:hypothetical protein